MLKACWDCVTGSGATHEGGYGTQLNGGTESVPLRPVRSTQRNMFVIPRALNYGDILEVSGKLNNPSRFTANLLTGSQKPNFDNIACQLDADFDSNNITLRIKENGEQSDLSTAPTNTNPGAEIRLNINFSTDQTVVFFVNDSHAGLLELRHGIEEITFLEMQGVNVTKLFFTFAE